MFKKQISEFATLSYNVLSNNCWHFSLSLLQFLDPGNLYEGQHHLQSSIRDAQAIRRGTYELFGRENDQAAECAVTLSNFITSDTAAASSQQYRIM